MMCEGPLTQEVYNSEWSYPIRYYDNPLQPGITPMWSDQNVLGGTKAKNKTPPRKELNFEEFQRRKKIALAMLENGPPDPMAALEEKYRTKMLAQQHQMAIRGQDVYEDDAELDCNEYAKSLAQDKGKDADASSSSPMPSSWG